MRGRLRELEEESRGLASRREQREVRARLDEIQSEAADRLGPAATVGDGEPALRPVEPGATVSVLSLGQQGTVVSVSGGEAEVQLGQFKMRIPTDDLQVLSRSERKAERAVEYQPMREAPPMEIDVRGWRADEAQREIDQYLHDNYMHGQGTVRIVHGKGTGALRKAIRQQLGGHPLVKSFQSEEAKAGGEGVTVVKLAV
jgi:DNA mismatch repair protein MutS2